MIAQTRAGKVITFYSYKGGTGRSMALANVACLLAQAAQQGQAPGNILIVDWDLEAPGLHRFFRDQFTKQFERRKNRDTLLDAGTRPIAIMPFNYAPIQ